MKRGEEEIGGDITCILPLLGGGQEGVFEKP
jgi:hypothetical protein